MKNVAIVAAGHGRDDAPFGDKDWECWGVNATWMAFRDVEHTFARWFELHRRSYLRWEHGGEDNEHFRWLKSLRHLPVFVQDMKDWPEVPMARAFPEAKVTGLSKRYGRYHACSIDWMIATAIWMGAKRIGLYGVEQQHTAEPISSRACCEFWSGFAEARGIHVSSVAGSTFKIARLDFTDIPYAYDPTWLTMTDHTNHGHNPIARMTQRLKRVVEGGDAVD